MKKLIALYTAVVIVAGCASAHALVARTTEYNAALSDDKGAPVGTAKITQTPKGVLVGVDIAKMAPGWHAIHVHGKGTCEDHADHFKASGSHAAREGEAHGYLDPAGPHAGDLPNFFVHDDGTAKFQFYSAQIGFGDLQDEDGAALIVHAKPDDYKSQPSGEAGDRLACGVIAP